MTDQVRNLSELLARVEKAEGPSRELDGRIAWAMGWRFNGGVMPNDDDFKYWPDIAGHWHKPGDRFADILNKAEYRSETEGFPSGRWDDPPTWTSSIDAAVALVEKVLPGWGWQTGCPLPYDKPREFYASVWRNGLHVGHDGWINEDGKPMPPRPSPAIYRPTPALALCAALLKAIIAKEAKP